MQSFIEHWHVIKEPFFSILNEESHADTLAIGFGVTGGILTVVGLISIFVSLNTQHSIQLCRDIYLDIKSKAYIWGDLSNFDKDFHQYKHLIEEGIPDQLTKRILLIAIASIIFVLLVWGLLLVILINNIYTIFLFVTSSLILISFVFQLIALYKPTKRLQDLPSPDQFFDLSDDTVNSAAILKQSIRTFVSYSDTEVTLLLHTTYPFTYNNEESLTIESPVIRFENSRNRTLREEKIVFNSKDNEYYLATVKEQSTSDSDKSSSLESIFADDGRIILDINVGGHHVTLEGEFTNKYKISLTNTIELRLTYMSIPMNSLLHHPNAQEKALLNK